MLKIPKHVAIIMDGNGSWARSRGFPRSIGHYRGVDAAKRAVQFAIDNGIEVLTIFAFSSENWNRPKSEVSTLMALLKKLVTVEVKNMLQRNVKLKVIGERVGLSQELVKNIDLAVEATKNCTGLTLNVAINYGGRWDVVNAAKQISCQVKQGKIDPQQINEQLFSRFLSIGDFPDPELLIRTSGVQRISNFLLWQLAYTELFFTDVCWPDFNNEHFQQALVYYSTRNRKFGGLSIDTEKNTFLDVVS